MGAAIARGSQNWNGNCALFVSAPSTISTSIGAWKKTDAEKQELQKERDELKDSLKEARLSLAEAQDRAESFRDDIKSLEQEIGELKKKLP